MEDFAKRLYEELPIRLTTFLDSLTGNELLELQKVDGRLIAKVYQAGAQFSVDFLMKLADEEKAAKNA